MQHQQQPTPTQVERGVTLAKQGINMRWEWGDLALSVAPPSEKGIDNGGLKALSDLLERISANGEIPISDLPTAASLRDYRDGCAVIPPGEYRKGVTIYFARELGQLEKDPVKRLAVIDTLRAEHSRGKATIDALRVMYDKAPTRTPGKAEERMENEIKALSPNEQASLAASLLGSEEVRAAILSLTSDEQAAIFDAGNALIDEEDRRNDEREVIRHEESIDTRSWRLFRHDLQPNWMAAGKRLGHFEWTDERVRWMQEKGDTLRDEFYSVAADHASLSTDDLNRLLESEQDA